MAKPLFQFSSVNNIFSIMVHAGLLQLFMVAMAIAERCTRAVPVQEYPVKKVHVLRRVPATCSNWDKAWAWLTKVDCGTKYRLDLVTVPSREVRQYKLQYVCCDGDTECNEADNIHAPGYDATDEKFLAIVLGSTAACVVIIIIIFAITFYTKKSRCSMSCNQENHYYTSADGEDVRDENGEEKHQPEDIEGEKDYKACDAEYAEICDPRLPRYTDIFKESLDNREDPFNKASAPPMYSAVTPGGYINSNEVTTSIPLNSGDDTQISQRASPVQGNIGEDDLEGQHHVSQNVSSDCADVDDCEKDIVYYNVKEKMKRKKRSASSSSNSKGDMRVVREGNTSDAILRTSSRNSRGSNSASMEMIAKSSSASERIMKMPETSNTKQNRRSAPPGSLDASIGYIHGYPLSKHSASTSFVIRSSSNNACTVIHEAELAEHRGIDKRNKLRASKDNLHQNPVRKTSCGSDSSPIKKNLKKSTTYNGAACDVRNTSGSISPSNGAVLTSYDSSSLGNAIEESETSQPSENDSLLRSPSCHSGCGGDTAFEDCDRCSKYHKLAYPSDSDVASLHIYQCLEDVRKECQELTSASGASGVETALS